MKVINLSSRYGKTDAGESSKTSLKSELNQIKIKFDMVYSIESSIDSLIGYKKKNYDSQIGWGILGVSILYIYFIESLFYSYDSFLTILLIIIGEVFILRSPKIIFKIIKNLKLSNSTKTLSLNELNTLKGLIQEKEKIKQSIRENKVIHLKYLEKYLFEEKFRKNFFNFMSEHAHLCGDSTFNKSAEYASKKIIKNSFGFRRKK